MALPTRARIAVVLAISLLMLVAPGALAGTLALYRPDAEIRLGSNTFVGDNIYNLHALGQKVFNTGVVGQKLTFFIKISNESLLPDRDDSFKVRRSAGYNSGYRVRYYDAEGTDVTGRVTVGSFTTPILDNGEEYVMRATVKIRPQATLCSFTSRLITVSSVSLPTEKDAVRFTAALDTPGLNCPPVAVNDTNSITENAVSVSGNLLANDIDPDGDTLGIVDYGAVPTARGTLLVNPDGSYTWFLNNAALDVNALNNGETLTQVIQYSVMDGSLTSNIATLTITIHGVTDPD